MIFYISISYYLLVINSLVVEVLNNSQFIFRKNPAYSICSDDEASSSSSGSVRVSNVDTLIYVHSSPVNLKKRIAIRETWRNDLCFLGQGSFLC